LTSNTCERFRDETRRLASSNEIGLEPIEAQRSAADKVSS
jgi:hypothetical protein